MGDIVRHSVLDSESSDFKVLSPAGGRGVGERGNGES